ncbi:MAG: response regulator [Anaerolineae bacterium]|nr:response regulator [Anaerolineae bacterium]
MAKILIADDDQVMLGLLTTLMELEGDEAITISRPEDIIPTVEKEQPALILMDYHLSGGDSLPALTQLKQKGSALAHIPVIVASGMDLRRECEKAGADEFILKPFRPAQLLELIHNITKSQP